MPQFTVGQQVTYEECLMTVHFVSPDLEQVTCVYRGETDRLFHSIVLNANLLDMFESIDEVEDIAERERSLNEIYIPCGVG